MKIKALHEQFSVLKLHSVNDFAPQGLYFLSVTDEEISLVCEERFSPKSTAASDNGWRAFRIEGILDFSLIGILSKITALLAENNIGIFAVSTYNTDYIMTKAESFERALSVMEAAGYEIIR